MKQKTRYCGSEFFISIFKITGYTPKEKGVQMRPPYESYQRAQLGALLLAVVLAVVGLFQLEHQWIILLMFYVLAASFALEGMVEMKRQQKVNAIIQLVRAVILLFFTTILYF